MPTISGVAPYSDSLKFFTSKYIYLAKIRRCLDLSIMLEMWEEREGENYKFVWKKMDWKKTPQLKLNGYYAKRLSLEYATPLKSVLKR